MRSADESRRDKVPFLSHADFQAATFGLTRTVSRRTDRKVSNNAVLAERAKKGQSVYARGDVRTLARIGRKSGFHDASVCMHTPTLSLVEMTKLVGSRQRWLAALLLKPRGLIASKKTFEINILSEASRGKNRGKEERQTRG